MKRPLTLLMRRRFLVDLPFQLSVMGRVIALSLFVQLAVLVGLMLPLARNVNSDQRDELLRLDAAVVLLHIHDNVWWIILVSIVLPGLVVTQITHRIAGPLLRVRRELVELGEGRLPAMISTRSKDYLKPEIALLHETVTRLAQRADALRADHARLLAALTKARGQCGDDPLVRESLATAVTAASELGARLGAFLTPRPGSPDLPRSEPTHTAVPLEAAAR